MSAKTSKTHVNFSSDDGEMKERKKRYLTAKYGQHQMNLIKKRLKVELWMYEELQTLFQTGDSYSDFDVDLDELLDLDVQGRRNMLRSKLADAKQSKELVESFIVRMLEKLETL